MFISSSIFQRWAKFRSIFAFFASCLTIFLAYIIDFVTGCDRVSNQVLSPAAFFAALVVSPIFETIGFQVTPHFILSKLGIKSAIFKLMAMSVPFALAHDGGLAAAIYPLTGGLVFGAAYIMWVKSSHGDAFLVVAAAHFFHNLIVIILMLALGGTVHATTNN